MRCNNLVSINLVGIFAPIGFVRRTPEESYVVRTAVTREDIRPQPGSHISFGILRLTIFHPSVIRVYTKPETVATIETAKRNLKHETL